MLAILVVSVTVSMRAVACSSRVSLLSQPTLFTGRRVVEPTVVALLRGGGGGGGRDAQDGGDNQVSNMILTPPPHTQKREKGGRASGQPSFVRVSYTVVHLPLAVLQIVMYYEGVSTLFTEDDYLFLSFQSFFLVIFFKETRNACLML